MSNIKESGFDYSLVDPEMADFLRERENNIKDKAADVFLYWGRELKKAQEKLAGNNQHDGVFQKWYESMGFKKQSVYNYMNYSELVVQRLDEHDQIKRLPKKLVYEIAKPGVDTGLQDMAINGKFDSYKEYRNYVKLLELGCNVRDITVEHALNTGHVLMEAVKKFSDQKLFYEWCMTEVRISQDVVDKFMTFYRNHPDVSESDIGGISKCVLKNISLQLEGMIERLSQHKDK